MARAERAKIFAPFDALRGFRAELEKMEHHYLEVEKIELSEDSLRELDETFSKIKKGDMITVVYYHDRHYEKVTGKVSAIVPEARYIKIVQREISLDDIKQIEI